MLVTALLVLVLVLMLGRRPPLAAMLAVPPQCFAWFRRHEVIAPLDWVGSIHCGNLLPVLLRRPPERTLQRAGVTITSSVCRCRAGV